MADVKITDLTELAATSVANDDLLEIVDFSASASKKVKVQSLLSAEISDTPSANQNDYSPTNIASATQVSLNIGASIKLTGLAAGWAGKVVTITNTSSDYLLWLEHQNTASTAANRFILPKGFPAFLMPDDSITLRYDGTASRWRVQHWPTQGPAMGLSSFDDFTGGTGSATGVGIGQWAHNFSGTAAGGNATAYLANSTEKPFGLVSASTGTTATGRSSFSTAAANCVWGQGPILMLSRVAVQAATDGTNTFSVRVGVSDGGNAATPVSGVNWEYRWTGSAVEWSQTAWAASVATRVNTGSPTADTNYIWAVIFVNAAGTRADMIWSQDSAVFTKASSVTTGLPSAGTAVGLEAMSITKTVGTTARLASIDLAGYRFDGVRG